MKIACIGNMNNGLFPLYRYLKDVGYNVTLFRLPQEPEHFQPQADSFEHDTTTFPLLDWHYDNWLTYDKQKLKSLLKPFDKLIAQGVAPAYIHKAGRTADIIVPYGGDMYRIPHYSRIKNRGQFKSNIKRFFFANAQKQGFRNAKHIIMEETNDFFEGFLHKLEPKGIRHKFALPHVYNKQYVNYEARYGDVSNYLAAFKRIQTAYPFIVFQHARQMWKDIPDQTYSKGNDLLIKAFALHCSLNKEAALVLYEYGNDVANSKALIEELNITDRVFWMPLMPRKEIMMGLSMARVVVGELTHSYFSYGVVHEALVMGIPLMHHRIDNQYQNLYPTLYPMLHAHTTDQILNWLNKLHDDPDTFKQLGSKGRDWLHHHAIDNSIHKIINILNEGS
ncbi:MAG: glycosyltransferase [Bacteroidia bacterium]|jgi:hypothetical protein|nr:glycosyltransferase [Bacteroidia bacterium]